MDKENKVLRLDKTGCYVGINTQINNVPLVILSNNPLLEQIWEVIKFLAIYEVRHTKVETRPAYW